MEESQHPGGELAILISAGFSNKFHMIHPNDVVEKYAPDAVIGVVGRGKAKKIKGGGKSASVATDKDDPSANLEFWGGWRMEAFDGTPGVLLVSVRSCVNACCYLIIRIIHEPCAAVFAAMKFSISAGCSGCFSAAITSRVQSRVCGSWHHSCCLLVQCSC